MIDYPNISEEEKNVCNIAIERYMIRVYSYMAQGLALSVFVGLVLTETPTLVNIFSDFTKHGEFIELSKIGVVVTMAIPIMSCLYFAVTVRRLSLEFYKKAFWYYSAVSGLLIGGLKLQSVSYGIFRVYGVMAVVFAAANIYGLITKKDFNTFFRPYFVFAVGAIILINTLNFLCDNSPVEYATTTILVLLFVLVIHWDTNKLRYVYCLYGDIERNPDRIALVGALNFVADFAGIFAVFLRLGEENRNALKNP
ncbi:Bax inhibitor-1/YccA family protein [Rickettsia endosymbiont of Cardiosporidium cionae]|uniref:Bax inhibitor-1/YccA family protein n=1 Tax=Rickettsia endosymbiont of Cardiosporidium cionae TaxID=2777155 RepID=UPI001894AA80|nr:Bax inhibitor-1 family protein [Rickettsia endosymbiont of Cardiosporidium cionae]KAF8818789.1 Bax inhibitor-1/YccA family protein [Rickettsia endosymbiont of Cardiosporidium cionae]